MGYYSEYNVFSDAEEDVHEEIIKDFKSWCEDAEWGLFEDGCCEESMKWYEFDADIRKLSKKYPEVLFECYRKGEESEDFEKYRVVNGELKSVMGSIVYPEF